MNQTINKSVTLCDFLNILPRYQQVRVVIIDAGYYLSGTRRKVQKQLTEKQKLLPVNSYWDSSFVPVPFKRELVRQVVIYCERY